MKTVLATGGAGYVGSHCCKAFAAAGWRVITVDDLSRGSRDAVKWGPLIECDVGDQPAMEAIIARFEPDLIAHFAAFAYVGESVERPDIYYRNNSAKTLALLDSMRETNVSRLLFSSSCATFGLPAFPPITEEHPQHPVNPYGWSKLIIERMLEDYAPAFGLSFTSLRYFNAAGADPEGEIGECHEPETHVIPLAVQAALNGTDFRIFGTDFDTPDGSAVRDYVHVLDLARAHVLAGEHLLQRPGAEFFNLGTGVGTSVLQIARAVEEVTGLTLNRVFEARRAGDPPALVACADKAKADLGWRMERSDISTITQDALAWLQKWSGPPDCDRV